MTNLDLFDCNLRQIAETKLGRGWQARIARFLRVSAAMVSFWADKQEMPPDDTQWLIALFLGCASRDEIWPFRKNLFPEIREVAEAEARLMKAQEKFTNKVDKFLPGASDE